MNKIAYSLAFCLSAVLATSPAALSGDRARTYRGMHFAYGVVCEYPELTRDLISVIHDKELYQAWFHGYAGVSGHCAEWWESDFELVRKYEITNTSWDGHRAEMWEVLFVEDSGARRSFWAIIFPDATGTHGGVGA